MPGEPSLEEQELPVDGGQDPALQEYVAQVGGGPPVRQLLERFVGQSEPA
ncbi:hypothetical protein [Arthrobacter sp. ES1]|nr:hypothetical protein [Arthrobacter sp. ES1]MDJ0354255.1 hypothetical protein [Pseudarthrobacter sp. PH31-O2]